MLYISISHACNCIPSPALQPFALFNFFFLLQIEFDGRFKHIRTYVQFYSILPIYILFLLWQFQQFRFHPFNFTCKIAYTSPSFSLCCAVPLLTRFSIISVLKTNKSNKKKKEHFNYSKCILKL